MNNYINRQTDKHNIQFTGQKSNQQPSYH